MLTLLGIGALACTDASAPGPTQPQPRFTADAVQCNPDRVRELIDALYGVGSKGAEDQRSLFEQGQEEIDKGKADDGFKKFAELIDTLLADRAAGTLQTLDAAGATDKAVAELINQLFACAGKPLPGDLTGTLAGDADIELCVPGETCSLRPPYQQFAAEFPTTFFKEPALVSVVYYPTGPLQSVYTEYPPRYQITVSPYDAQANYDPTLPNFGQGRPNPPGGRATVGVCPENDHVAGLQVLRVPEANRGENSFLPAVDVSALGLKCGFVERASLDEGAGDALGRGVRALQRFGSLAVGFFAPKPLYAWDVGVGGETELMSYFVAADPTPSLVGSAGFLPENGGIRLTDAQQQLVMGGAWYPKTQLAYGFTATFTFRTNPEDPKSPGGDGIAFVIQNSRLGNKAAGGTGGALGYADVPSTDFAEGITNSLAVEFDLWDNIQRDFPDGDADPSANHIAVHTRGALPNSAGGSGLLPDAVVSLDAPIMSDGLSHTAKIVYTPSLKLGSGGVLYVYIDGSDVPVLKTPISLSDVVDDAGMAYVGLTAAVGTAVQTHDVLSWTFTTP